MGVSVEGGGGGEGSPPAPGPGWGLRKLWLGAPACRREEPRETEGGAGQERPPARRGAAHQSTLPRRTQRHPQDWGADPSCGRKAPALSCRISGWGDAGPSPDPRHSELAKQGWGDGTEPRHPHPRAAELDVAVEWGTATRPRSPGYLNVKLSWETVPPSPYRTLYSGASVQVQHCGHSCRAFTWPGAHLAERCAGLSPHFLGRPPPPPSPLGAFAALGPACTAQGWWFAR